MCQIHAWFRRHKPHRDCGAELILFICTLFNRRYNMLWQKLYKKTYAHCKAKWGAWTSDVSVCCMQHILVDWIALFILRFGWKPHYGNYCAQASASQLECMYIRDLFALSCLKIYKYISLLSCTMIALRLVYQGMCCE